MLKKSKLKWKGREGGELPRWVRCGVQENRTMGGLKCSEEGIIIRLIMLMIIIMMIIISRI